MVVRYHHFRKPPPGNPSGDLSSSVNLRLGAVSSRPLGYRTEDQVVADMSDV